MKIWSDSFGAGERIPEKYAFGKHDPEKHIELADNLNPHLKWSDLPEGTRSLCIVVHDSDGPTKPDDVNQEGKTVPADLERADFYHWLLVDLAPNASPIDEGEFSKEVTPKGKRGPDASRDCRQGLNDYTSWFEGDEAMEGRYYGYDGPCPPWNDERVHNYHFTLYALDVDRAPVEGDFRGPDLLKSLEGHVIEKASFTGTYAINPSAKPAG